MNAGTFRNPPETKGTITVASYCQSFVQGIAQVQLHSRFGDLLLWKVCKALCHGEVAIGFKSSYRRRICLLEITQASVACVDSCHTPDPVPALPDEEILRVQDFPRLVR